MLPAYVADTMAVVLHYENRRLPLPVKALFEAAAAGQPCIGVSAMTLAEVGYLFERQRIGVSVGQLLDSHTQRGLSLLPLDAEVVQAAFAIADIPELHDRLIAATAWVRQVPLLTNDPVIRASRGGPVLWNQPTQNPERNV